MSSEQWIDSLLLSAAGREALSGIIPEWHPRSNGMTYPVLGCGSWGCVIATSDPGVVLKITTDDTEAEFARMWADNLCERVCVDYYATRCIQAQDTGGDDSARIHLLWRDAAQRVGQIVDVITDHQRKLIGRQHSLAQEAFRLLRRGRRAEHEIDVWRDAMQKVAASVSEMNQLADGIIRVFDQQGIFFGDVKTDNIGRMMGRWVITDPGMNVAIIDR